MLGITDLKVGRAIQLDGVPFVVTYNQYSKQARGAGVMKTKLRNLLTGRTMERTFQGAEKVEEADIRYGRAQFLYANAGDYEFMDQETFETVTFTGEVLGDTAHFLLEGTDVDIQYFGDTPINVKVPPKVTFTVIETEPGVKGDTAQGGNKDATIDTGYVLKVPLFVNKEDKIVVNTDTGEYVERAKS